ncbi:MAG: 3-isopropylmalate dehydratase small subunit [Odoribacteraceae bacterium]|jgi:3-isopropylmalate/(R)-2-methylmalate dehydratase small subunit|nr:3-isopropylmalate dehydratase small subunit [Odoribacteraceae bacterium]
MKEKFITLLSTVVPLPFENIDTDRIIPARFLKTITRGGLGQHLFADWMPNGLPLNHGSILVTGPNFGCGSSREHAAWAILDAGFRAIISTSFADIFRVNALNNGLLTIQASPAFVEKIFAATREDSYIFANIDLASRTVIFQGQRESFDISPYKQQCLLNGLDDIDYLLSIRKKIRQYEKRKP